MWVCDPNRIVWKKAFLSPKQCCITEVPLVPLSKLFSETPLKYDKLGKSLHPDNSQSAISDFGPSTEFHKCLYKLGIVSCYIFARTESLKGWLELPKPRRKAWRPAWRFKPRWCLSLVKSKISARGFPQIVPCISVHFHLESGGFLLHPA